VESLPWIHGILLLSPKSDREPSFVNGGRILNVYGAKESIPSNEFRQRNLSSKEPKIQENEDIFFGAECFFGLQKG
jgi:hypothetical protein